MSRTGAASHNVTGMSPSLPSGSWPTPITSELVVRAAAEPEMRASPVSGFSWNSAPRAKEKGKRPEKNALRKSRWAKGS